MSYRIEISTIAQKWMTIMKIRKHKLPGPPFRQGPRNSETYTDLHGQRPPVDRTGRVAFTYSTSWLWGQREAPGYYVFLLVCFLVCLFGWNFVIDFNLNSRLARDLKFGALLRSGWQYMKA
ncbi:hypothetical protein TNCV_74011 [Trichonephila clavipes]|nr:hypothetical protein TNCV_74011 [Trichonephila clavipes]